MKYLYTDMGDKIFALSADIIADARARYIMTLEAEGLTPKDVYDEVYKETLDDNYEIENWARNNMRWEDVKDKGVWLPKKPKTEEERRSAWINPDDRWIEDKSQERLI